MGQSEYFCIKLAISLTRLLQWHARTLNAFCRHDGAWETSKQPFRNWNTEMLVPVVEDLTVAWGNLDEALIDCKEKCLADLIKLLENVRTDLNGKRIQTRSLSTSYEDTESHYRDGRGRS